MVTIYLVTNLVNNKVYVGQTRQKTSVRWTRHQQDSAKGMDLRFYRAIRKYGVEKFDLQEIAVAGSQEQANNLEKLWILCLRATEKEFGYNGTFGGEGGKMTAEANAKKSASLKASWTPERRKSHGQSRKGMLTGEANPMYGRTQGTPHTEETKLKLSAIRVKMFEDPDFKQKMTEANTGKHHTEEGKANISAALVGNQFRKGTTHSDEDKAKISAGLKLAFAEGRRKKSGGLKKGTVLGSMSEEDKLKRSEGVKRARAGKFWSTRKKAAPESLTV